MSPGRSMPGAPGYVRRTKFDFTGYDRFLKKYSKELDLYVKVSFFKPISILAKDGRVFGK